MRGTPAFSRTLTVIAVALLTFDGAALAALGLVSGRTMLVLVGLVFFLSAGIVMLYWRWYSRTLRAIAAERATLAEEANTLQDVQSL